jgi:hypothetical protein
MPLVPSMRSWCVMQILRFFLSSLPSLSLPERVPSSHSFTQALCGELVGGGAFLAAAGGGALSFFGV